jgi:hypothetical protein
MNLWDCGELPMNEAMNSQSADSMIVVKQAA